MHTHTHRAGLKPIVQHTRGVIYSWLKYTQHITIYIFPVGPCSPYIYIYIYIYIYNCCLTENRYFSQERKKGKLIFNKKRIKRKKK